MKIYRGRDAPSPLLLRNGYVEKVPRSPMFVTLTGGTAVTVREARIRQKKRTQLTHRIRKLDDLCRYCMERPAETVDHVIPKSRGGGNGVKNLVGCCLFCNNRKAAMTPKEAGMKLHLPLRFYDYVKGPA